jgi:DinB superfamily
MTDDARGYLSRQLETAWMLASYHLDGLATEECLWRPASRGLHVQQAPDGAWCADWPDHEGYDLGPTSIAWITWHMGFWWSMVLDHSFGAATLTRENVAWPGSADGVRRWLAELEQRWRTSLDALTDDDLRSPERTKNAAELGYARFLYAVRNT